MKRSLCAFMGWVVLAAMASCARCSDPGLAELTDLSGAVDRDYATSTERWEPARRGARFDVGDGLRTGADGRAQLSLFPQGHALVEAHTILRFSNVRPTDGVELLEVEEGIVEIDSEAVEISLRAGGDVARVQRRSRVRIRAPSSDEAVLDVIVGKVQVERASPEAAAGEAVTQTIAQGDSVALGSATPKSLEPDAKGVGEAEAIDEDAQDAAESDAARAPSLPPTSASGRPPDVALDTSERATYHVAKVPVTLALPLPECEGQPANVRVLGRGKRRELSAIDGERQVVADFSAGRHRVQQRCGRRVVGETSLRVVRDAGTLELPRTAPRVEVSADGRKYTVRYQNRLPTVSISWPDPPAGPYTLHVASAGGRTLTKKSDAPEVVLGSGTLREGEHRVLFANAAGKQAKATTLRIVFDNTARVGYVSQPADGAAARGSIVVSGGSLVDAQVSIGGRPVKVDGRGRFETTLEAASSQRAIAIRISHPATGVHYYLRRLGNGG